MIGLLLLILLKCLFCFVVDVDVLNVIVVDVVL